MNVEEVAHRADVSSVTISRALSNSGYMREETRQEVLRAVEEYSYVPSIIAGSLSIQDSLNVRTVILDIENEFFSKAISGINKVVESYHYNIVFLETSKALDKEHDFSGIVESQRLKGVIITPISETDTVTRDYLFRLGESGISVVLVNRDVKKVQFDGVFVDSRKGSYDGVMELIKVGYERITIITDPRTSKSGKSRCQGYLQAMEDSRLAVPEEYIACGDFKIAKAYECAGWLLGLVQTPAAIFTSNNLSIPGCFKYLTKHKVKIGRNIPLMRFDDIDALRTIDYRISVVDRDAREQGQKAIRLLQKCFEDSGESCQRGKRITIPYKVILQGSEHRKTT